VPATQVELDHGCESLHRVLNVGDRQEHLGVAHEAADRVSSLLQPGRLLIYFVIRSSILRGSNMKVGRTTRLRSAPGRSWEMMCPSTVESCRQCQDPVLGIAVDKRLTVSLVGLDNECIIVLFSLAAINRRLATWSDC